MNVRFEGNSGHDAGVTPFPLMTERTCSLRCHGGKCSASVSRLDGAFCGVNIAINYLEVRQAPIGEQLRPRRSPVFAPHPKQRHAMINFGALPQSSAALAAATRLQPPQEPGVAARRVPKLPRDHTGAVPGCVHVSATLNHRTVVSGVSALGQTDFDSCQRHFAYPQQRTFVGAVGMSKNCQKQTWCARLPVRYSTWPCHSY